MASTPIAPVEAKPGVAIPIRYNLAKPGKVSLNIYDGKGAIVRELLHAAPRTSGSKTEQWDERDDAGKPVPGGNYSWKMLSTPGFGAEYITNPGSNYVVDTSADSAYDSQSPGTHAGPAAIAIDATNLYVGAGGTEHIESGIFIQPLNGTDGRGAGGHPGAKALASVNGILWEYRNDGNIYKAWANVVSAKYNNESASDMAISSTSVILSYPTQGVIRWLDYSGTQTRVVNVAGAKSVDVAPNGTVYSSAGTSVVEIPVDATSATPFITTGLSNPHRAAINFANGDIYIIDGTTFGAAQVKRYNSAGVLQQTYGAAAGPQNGLYDATQKKSFAGSTDIAVDGKGNFWVADGNAAPRRVARFTVGGAWQNDWYGGQLWAPWIAPEPDDPGYVWMASAWGSMIRAKINFASKTWSVDSVYTFNGLADGLIGNHNNGETWRARIHNGVLYLCRAGITPFIIKVDRANRKLIPVVVTVGGFWKYGPHLPKWMNTLAADRETAIWTDANGDGRPLNADGTPQNNEFVFGPGGYPSVYLADVDRDMNYFFYSGTKTAPKGNKILKFAVTGWNSVGAPVYGTFPDGEIVADLPPRVPGEIDGRRGGYFTTDAVGNIWGGFNPGLSGWGYTGDAFVARWNPNGTLAWQSGRMNGKPGSLGALRHIYGTVNNGANYNCLVIGRFSHEWPQEGVTPIYVYDQDGLYAGHLIGRPVNQGSTPNWRYGLGGEALSGDIVKDSSGNVYFYGNWVNEGRVYKITGWNGWQRATGKVTVPAGYTAPAFIEELPGPSGKGTGLKGEYFTSADLSEAPALIRTDARLDFSKEDLGNYSARWTGTLTPRRSGWHMFRQTRGWRSPNKGWVNGVNVTSMYLHPNGWPGGRENFGNGRSLWLEAGRPYSFRLDYPPGHGAEGILMQWAEPETNGNFTSIPTSQLSPDTPVVAP